MTEVVGKIYSFSDLEIMLNDRGSKDFFRVKNVQYGLIALMCTFLQNFSTLYKSGDAVLFYEDGEQHSADTHDEFILLEIIPIKP